MDIRDLGLLIRSITANANQYIGKHIEEHGIKIGQFDYFLMISMRPGINQLELAKMKNAGKASVTKALKILETEGYIKRIPDENDRRNSLCYVTEKGEAVVYQFMMLKEETEKKLFKGFDDDEFEVLLKSLNKLYKNSESLF